MKNFFIFSLLLVVLYCGELNEKENQVREFITKHVSMIKPLIKEKNIAYWNAATTGKEEYYDRYSELNLKTLKIYSNPDEYAMLKKMKESGEVRDPVLSRQLDVLYNSYLENQIDPELLKTIVDLSTEIEKKFSTFRGTIDGEKVTDNEIKEILKSEKDLKRREKAWLASKQVGTIVADDLVRLVKLRNQGAQNLGFDNFHTLSLTTSEQSVEKIDEIFNELYQLTNEPFMEIKTELDQILSKIYGIRPDELMPWHYHDPFFQETPLIYQLDLDEFYKEKDIKQLAQVFYQGMDLDVESILKNSDLYEREGKNPHAFCTDIDQEGDVRILCNLKNNEQWMETLLHELGHAVYDKYQKATTPFLLRKPAHIFTTEAIAMLLGRLSRNSAWMQKIINLSDKQRNEIDKVSRKYAQLKQLIFARWALVMYDFEKNLYKNPDQDLNTLWWNTVKQYQFLHIPPDRNEPDWAAKIHFSIAPCYYHNYLLGELLASQLHNYIVHNILNLDDDRDVSYVNQKNIGKYLSEKVFAPGAYLNWNDMIQQATGEYLTAKYFVNQFIK